MLAGILLFIVEISLISVLYMSNILLTVLMLLLLVAVLIFWHSEHDIYFFVFGAIIGSVGEVIAVYFGAWQYTNPLSRGYPSGYR